MKLLSNKSELWSPVSSHINIQKISRYDTFIVNGIVRHSQSVVLFIKNFTSWSIVECELSFCYLIFAPNIEFILQILILQSNNSFLIISSLMLNVKNESNMLTKSESE